MKSCMNPDSDFIQDIQAHKSRIAACSSAQYWNKMRLDLELRNEDMTGFGTYNTKEVIGIGMNRSRCDWIWNVYRKFWLDLEHWGRTSDRIRNEERKEVMRIGMIPRKFRLNLERGIIYRARCDRIWNEHMAIIGITYSHRSESGPDLPVFCNPDSRIGQEFEIWTYIVPDPVGSSAIRDLMTYSTARSIKKWNQVLSRIGISLLSNNEIPCIMKKC